MIEEAPSPALSQETKDKLYEAAVQAAKAVNYKNAGTVEFIMDADENFYFLEMNTRLQVEHPISEEITGTDLVKWQLLTAMDQPLPISDQSQLVIKGHAIEFRLYAEDSERFMPSPGKLDVLRFPKGEGIRIDSGYAEGNSVTPYYDPMIAKVIVSGKDRTQALERAQALLENLDVQGVKSNVAFFRSFIQYNGFKEGDYATNSIDLFRKQPKEQ